MIKKHTIFIISIFIVSFLTFACTSTKYYGINTTDFESQIEGNIFINSEAAGVNDIILNGSTKFVIGFENLVSGETQYKKWKGNITLDESVYDVQVRYKQNVGENGVTDILSVYIENLPQIYKFSYFDITGSTAIMAKYISENDLPVVLTDFQIDSKKYTVLLTSINTVPTMKNSMDSYLGLMSTDNQIFQIVDENGKIRAEFTKDYYRIFAGEPEIDVNLLWPCIASFSIVRNICAERQRINPF